MIRLLRVSAALLLLGAMPTGLGPAGPIGGDETRAGLLVTVAEVTADQATLWARSEAGHGPMHVTWAAVPGDERRATDVPVDAARDHTARVTMRALAPGTRYAYEVADGQDVVRGDFVTAPAPGATAPVHFVWSGDLGGGGHCRDVEDGYPIFRALERLGADFFLFVGDTIYADHRCGRQPQAAGNDFFARSLAGYHAKHRYNRADLAVQGFFRRTSVYAIWDDHDVTNNFAGPAEPLMPVGRQAFVDYWPIAGAPEERERLYRSVRWGKHLEVFILDTRQYRSVNAEPDGTGKTMLGRAQRAWLLDGLAASDATWKVIVSSVPLGMFTGGSYADAWSNANLFGFSRGERTGFRRERDLILRALRALKVTNVVFVSGDVHHAELIRHEPWPDFAVHEFVAGPLAARQGYPRPLDRSLNSHSLGSLGWAYNFGDVVVGAAGMTVRIIDATGAERAHVDLPASSTPTAGDAPRPASSNTAAPDESPGAQRRQARDAGSETH